MTSEYLTQPPRSEEQARADRIAYEREMMDALTRPFIESYNRNHAPDQDYVQERSMTLDERCILADVRDGGSPLSHRKPEDPEATARLQALFDRIGK